MQLVRAAEIPAVIGSYSKAEADKRPLQDGGDETFTFTFTLSRKIERCAEDRQISAEGAPAQRVSYYHTFTTTQLYVLRIDFVPP